MNLHEGNINKFIPQQLLESIMLELKVRILTVLGERIIFLYRISSISFKSTNLSDYVIII